MKWSTPLTLTLIWIAPPLFLMLGGFRTYDCYAENQTHSPRSQYLSQEWEEFFSPTPIRVDVNWVGFWVLRRPYAQDLKCWNDFEHHLRQECFHILGAATSKSKSGVELGAPTQLGGDAPNIDHHLQTQVIRCWCWCLWVRFRPTSCVNWGSSEQDVWPM